MTSNSLEEPSLTPAKAVPCLLKLPPEILGKIGRLVLAHLRFGGNTFNQDGICPAVSLLAVCIPLRMALLNRYVCKDIWFLAPTYTLVRLFLKHAEPAKDSPLPIDFDCLRDANDLSANDTKRLAGLLCDPERLRNAQSITSTFFAPNIVHLISKVGMVSAFSYLKELTLNIDRLPEVREAPNLRYLKLLGDAGPLVRPIGPIKLPFDGTMKFLKAFPNLEGLDLHNISIARPSSSILCETLCLPSKNVGLVNTTPSTLDFFTKAGVVAKDARFKVEIEFAKWSQLRLF